MGKWFKLIMKKMYPTDKNFILFKNKIGLFQLFLVFIPARFLFFFNLTLRGYFDLET